MIDLCADARSVAEADLLGVNEAPRLACATSGSGIGDQSWSAAAAPRVCVGPRRLASRRLVFALGVGLFLVFVVAGQPFPATSALALLGLATQAGAALAPSPGQSGPGLLSLLPAGLVVACFALLSLTFGAGLLGIPLWANRPLSLAGLTAISCAFALICAKRGGDVVIYAGLAVPMVSVWLGLLFTAALLRQPTAISSRIYGMGTDFMRHLVTVQTLRLEGSINPVASGYPNSFRVLLASLTSAGGVAADPAPLWLAASAATLCLLLLLCLAVSSLAADLAELLALPRVVSGAAAVIAGIAFVQTAWFYSFLATGSVMNMLAAVCLLSIVAVSLNPSFAATVHGCLIVVSSLALVSNSWQLVLPMAGLMAVPALWSGWRQLPRGAWVALVGSGLLISLAGLAGIRNSLVLPSEEGGEAVSGLAATTFAGLTQPEWWWAVGAVTCVGVAVLLWRNDSRALSLCIVGALTGLAGQTMWLLGESGSTWDLPLYYPAKALWTGMVVLVPVSVAGALWALRTVWNRFGELVDRKRLAGQGALGLMAGVACLALAGRVAAVEPHLVSIVRGTATPNWALAVVTHLRSLPANDPRFREPGAVVFGLVPSATAQEVEGGQVGRTDAMVLDALALLGLPGVYESAVKPSLVAQDLSAICDFLRAHPAALRVTGPNPDSGPGRLRAAGCPEKVVGSANWVRVPLGEEWLAGTRWADRSAWALPRDRPRPAVE